MNKENEELLKQAEKIKKDYSSVMADEEEEQFTFLDEVNKLIRILFKDTPTDIYTILSTSELEKWKKQKHKRAIKKFLSKFNIGSSLYFILLATITAFLVTEAIPFYAIAGAVTAGTYIKAVLTEISFIFLSGYKAIGKLEIAFVSLLRVAIFCLMLFIITSEVAMQGTGDIAKINNISIQISSIEKQVQSKEIEIDFYMKKDWGNNARQRIVERDKLNEQLRELKERQIKEGASEEVSSLLSYRMYGKAAFRLILMFISVLISRRIFKF